MPCTASSSSSFSQKSKNLFSLLIVCLLQKTIAPVPKEKKETSHEHGQTIIMFFLTFLGVVSMRKLTPARVLYQDDFLISYRVYMMTGSFHISLFEGKLHVDKYTHDSKSQALRMPYPFQATGRPISHRNRWLFRIYIIPLRDFVSE